MLSTGIFIRHQVLQVLTVRHSIEQKEILCSS
jgi:hypothetical protein